MENVTTPDAPVIGGLEPHRPKTEDPAPLRAVHTPNFPALLRQLGASLLVTTYQAGKLVMVRDEGDHLNTHFREKLLENSFVVPDAALADLPASLRGPAKPSPGAAGSAGNGGVPRVSFVTA